MDVAVIIYIIYVIDVLNKSARGLDAVTISREFFLCYAPMPVLLPYYA